MNRYFAATFFVAFGLCVIGCNTFPGFRDRGPGDTSNAIFSKKDVQASDLVAYMNGNADKVQAIRCDRVAIDVKQGNSVPFGIEGLLACQKPRQFRLKGKVAGTDQVDIGSNDDEFWYWAGKMDPRLFHCSYKDMATGQVMLPFPFNPDMVVCALNIGHYDPNARYEVRTTKDNTIELIEPTKSMQGEDIFKVTVFNRGAESATRPRVLAYVLKTKQGKDICRADIVATKVNKQANNAVLPEIVKIRFAGRVPAEDAEMKMQFYDLQTTTFNPESMARLFSRRDLGNLQSFDLARQSPDRPGGMGMSIQRTGAMDR